MARLAAILLLLLLVCGVRADAPDPLAPWTDRLTALSPDDPASYFALAEEMAALAEDADRRDREVLATARRLFVLAFELGRGQGDAGLSASASIGLAALATQERERRWLRALAAAMDPRHGSPDWSRVDPGAPSATTALRAAEVIGKVRAGNGRAALTLLEDPSVLAALSRHDRLLHPFGARGGLFDLQRQAGLWPCPECRNTRLGRDVRGRAALCGTCKGNPGPEMTPDLYVAHLRTEFALLSAEHATWSSQLATDGGVPLRDPDPDELASAMRIDPSRTLFRDGRWVRPDRADPDAQPDSDADAEPDRAPQSEQNTGRRVPASTPRSVGDGVQSR